MPEPVDSLDLGDGRRLVVTSDGGRLAALPMVRSADGTWRRARPGDGAAEALLDAMDAAESARDRAGWNDGDRRFHRQLAALTGNPVLTGLADHVAALMDQPLWQRLRDDSIARPGRARIHAAEHRMIYEAIVDGDPDAASFYATQHLERVRRYMTHDQES